MGSVDTTPRVGGSDPLRELKVRCCPVYIHGGARSAAQVFSHPAGPSPWAHHSLSCSLSPTPPDVICNIIISGGALSLTLTLCCPLSLSRCIVRCRRRSSRVQNNPQLASFLHDDFDGTAYASGE